MGNLGFIYNEADLLKLEYQKKTYGSVSGIVKALS
jgi:hypothetical protein